MDLEIGNGRRAAMGSTNRLKLGLFGANCSSGRAVTRVPERWSGSWPDCVRLAQMADRAGIEFMLPIGRWKGYGGDTDYQGATWETVAWACGLLAKTEQLTVFGTVHAPLISPLIAAKEFVTTDHIGEGRFGHEEPRHPRTGNDNLEFAISHHTSPDLPDLHQPKFKPAAAVSTTQVSMADQGSSVL